jgi:DNA repair protein RadC
LAKSNGSKTEPRGVASLTEEEEALVSRALAILKKKLERNTDPLSSPSAVRDFLRLKLAPESVEVFFAIWLDAQNRAISFEQLSRGTLTQTSVYAREVVKSALSKNAASVIFAHNHPSGVAEPSRADEYLTGALKKALDLIDVRLLDHIVIGSASSVSFAERGTL